MCSNGRGFNPSLFWSYIFREVRMLNRRSLLAMAAALVFLAGTLYAALPPAGSDKPALLKLTGQYRVKEKDGNFIAHTRTLNWDPRETAIIICDMWDDHYCRNAARRVAEMAPYMNLVVTLARQQGVLIIHCPSGCMDV